MRILHTSDWHLGKTLDGRSRIPEQEMFLDELADIAARERIDFIIVAGDVYDAPNPPPAAERLFYKSMKTLSSDGKRPVLAIAGNHDSESRLTASSPLATELGVLLAGRPDTVIPPGDYGHFSIANAGPGFFELALHGERAVVLTMPYPSEKRLNEVLSPSMDERDVRQSYAQKIGDIFHRTSENFRQDTINIATGHFYVAGGEMSASERDISLGGAYAVSANMLPGAQYIALGHLHRPQRTPAACKHAYYSGSPIQYAKSEAVYAKCVYIADIKAGAEPLVTKVPLKNYKPIDIWRVKGIQAALDMAEAHRNENSWVFLEVETDHPLQPRDIRTLHETKADIIQIAPILPGAQAAHGDAGQPPEQTLIEEFAAFYFASRGVTPTEEMKTLFLTICAKEADNEADIIKNHRAEQL